MLEIQPLLETYPIDTSPWPGLWQVLIKNGITHASDSVLSMILMIDEGFKLGS